MFRLGHRFFDYAELAHGLTDLLLLLVLLDQSTELAGLTRGVAEAELLGNRSVGLAKRHALGDTLCSISIECTLLRRLIVLQCL